MSLSEGLFLNFEIMDTGIIEIISWLLYFYLILTAIYNLIFSVASLKRSKKPQHNSLVENEILVLFPAYKEDQVIVDSVQNVLQQDYPEHLFEIVVIADKLKPKTLDILRSLPIQIVEAQLLISSKCAAINYALERITYPYDAVLVLDADNHIAQGYLRGLNDSINSGSKAIQTHRMAKNENTFLALLDGISEEINNTIFRKGHQALGFSSALIGSGMSFDFLLFKETIQTIDSFAEDKELEFKLIEKGIKIEYREDLFVFDEKVQQAKEFMGQKRRWIYYQLFYAKTYLIKGFTEFFKHGNIDLLDKVIQQLFPPRIILLFLSFVGFIVSISFSRTSIWIAWTILFVNVILSLALAIPRKYYTATTLKACIYLPFGFLMMVQSTLFPKRKKHDFGATSHYYIKKGK